MAQVPAWLEIAYRISSILGFFGGAWFALFVIWPSIRLQTKFIKAQEKNAVDQLIDKL
jgi:hypothetical protein